MTTSSPSLRRIARLRGPATVIAASVLVLPLSVPDHSYKLSGPFLPGSMAGDVSAVRITADGTRAVYVGNQDSFTHQELYSVPTDGSAAPIKLSGALVPGGNVSAAQVRISPDGARVVYRADQDADEVFELYSVPIDGSAAPVKLNAALAPGGDVGPIPITGEVFAISADGGRVVYLADQDTNDTVELYSVPIDGSAAPLKLNDALDSVGDVQYGFELSAALGRVVYLADPSDDQVKLFSVPLEATSAPLELDGTLAPLQEVGSFQLTADGNRAVYVDAGGGQRERLHVVPVDGSAAPTLLTPSVASFSLIHSYRISPDGARVVYGGEQDTNGVNEIYSVPLDASLAPVKLNAPLPAGGQILSKAYGIGGARVVYQADQDVNNVVELYSVPIDGSAAPIKLNGTLVAGGDVQDALDSSGAAFAIGPDGTRVVYTADQLVNDKLELFSAPIDGSTAAVKISGTLPGGGAVSSFFFNGAPFSPDSALVLFTAYQDSQHVHQLYSVASDGSASPVMLNGPLVAGGEVSRSFGWEFAGSHLVYYAEEDFDNVREIYAVPIAGGAAPVKLNGAMAPGPSPSSVGDWQVSPDGVHALYIANQDEVDHFELYSVHVDGSGAPLKLNAPLTVGHAVSDLQFSADGARVVFRTTAFYQEPELYCAPTDGSAPAVRLDRLDAGKIPSFRISPDGSRVVFLSDEELSDFFVLYSVPTDGSTLPVRLDLLPSDVLRDVTSYDISPDGTSVVFVQDRDTDDKFELYRVPIDASQLPTKLSGTLAPNRDVADFQITPDSARVVLRSDLLNNGKLELFQVPLTGGGVALISHALVLGGNVESYQVTPDSVGVVYIADTTVDETFELFGVPFGGSAFQYNPPLVAGGDVVDFLISPDDGRVLYRADQEADQRFDLYSVPIDRSQAPFRVNDVPVAGGSVGGPISEVAQISADSRYVVYRLDQVVDNQFELFSRRMDGSGVPIRLNGPLPVGGGVESFAISPDNRAVVFQASQEAANVFELFKAPLQGGFGPTKVSGQLVFGGDVEADSLGRVLQFSTDGQRVVYRAEQDTDTVAELYAVRLWNTKRIHRGDPQPAAITH